MWSIQWQSEGTSFFFLSIPFTANMILPPALCTEVEPDSIGHSSDDTYAHPLGHTATKTWTWNQRMRQNASKRSLSPEGFMNPLPSLHVSCHSSPSQENYWQGFLLLICQIHLASTSIHYTSKTELGERNTSWTCFSCLAMGTQSAHCARVLVCVAVYSTARIENIACYLNGFLLHIVSN